MSGQVGEIISDPPAGQLVVQWPNNVDIQPGQTSITDWMLERPALRSGLSSTSSPMY